MDFAKTCMLMTEEMVEACLFGWGSYKVTLQEEWAQEGGLTPVFAIHQGGWGVWGQVRPHCEGCTRTHEESVGGRAPGRLARGGSDMSRVLDRQREGGVRPAGSRRSRRYRWVKRSEKGPPSRGPRWTQ